MIEAAIVEEWLQATLSASLGSVPVEPFPLPASFQHTVAVAYKPMAGTDVSVVGAERIATEFVYEVVAVGPGRNIGAVVEAATLIDTAIEGQSGTTSDGSVLQCFRERIINLAYRSEDQTMRQMLGGIWRLFVLPTGA